MKTRTHVYCSVGTLPAVLLCCALLVLQAGKVRADTAEEPAGQPKIVFDTLTHDFGSVSQNTTLKHGFVFRNHGTAPLVIEQVRAG